MSIDLTMDFSVNKQNNTITVKKAFDAELPLVWRAYTDSEILDQWWAPKPWKARTKSMDFREGGRWLYAMVGPNGEEHWSVADYLKIEDQKSFTATDGFTDSEGKINKEMPQSKWDTDFKGVEDHTVVTFHITYPELKDLEATIAMGFKEGLTLAAQGLDEYFASLKK
ncbi:SRPBCC family protein [Flavobacterium wongokense]|uniref:SRPBCC family protein n=1 Tax=Flavobacterium wongokense TaxID=2910674 RepID=UPI001F234E88|nr:SRPBCC domain-containing protein [Flavobacterium sp. WG47]MCF6131896.1 SRPBCC domain-containing protein [Flavobacterium sp. WG47]